MANLDSRLRTPGSARCCCVIFSILVAAACTLPAYGSAIVAQYTFPAPTTNLSTGVQYAATTSDPNLNAGNVTAPVAELSITTASETGPDGVTVPANAPFLKANPNGNATSAALAVTNGTYFTITVTAKANFQLGCSTLTFNTARGNTSSPRGYVIRSSADNYTTTLSQQDLATVRPTYTPVSIDLSGALYQNLTTALTFRFYAYSPVGGSSVDFDDITLNGTVSPISVSTWQPASGNWSVAGNWDTPPSSSALTNLMFQGSSQFSSNDDIAGTFVLNSITHKGTFAGANTLSAGAGNTIQFAGANNFLFQNGSAALNVSAPLSLSASTTFGGTGTGALAISSALGGTGSLTMNGPFILSLSADSSAAFSGAVTISSGNLRVLNTTGSATGTNAVSIASGATLSGTGTITTNSQASRTVSTVDGATVAPGTASIGMLHIGSVAAPTNLVLTPNTNLSFRCATLGTNDVIAVNGNLTLGGLLTVTNAGGAQLGSYTILTYTGTLTNNGVTVVAVPSGMSGTIDTTTAGVVKLVLSPASVTAGTWTGLANDGKWSSATNWGMNAVPASGSTTVLTFPDLGVPYTVTNDLGTFVLNQIVCNGSHALTIGGNDIQFSGTSPSVMQNGTGTLAFTGNLALSANLTIGGTGSGDETVSGIISETTPSAIVKSGSGFNLFLNASNLFSGGTTINGGTVIVATESGLGLSN